MEKKHIAIIAIASIILLALLAKGGAIPMKRVEVELGVS